MTDPYARTPRGMFDRILQRLTALETRLGRILPGRLLPHGQEVTDWNDAVEVGFYTSASGVANSPPGGVAWAGQVYRAVNGRIIQEVSNPSTGNPTFAISWRRLFFNDTWTAWEQVGPQSVQTRIAGSTSVPGNTIVTAYSYTVPAVARDRVAIMSAAWLVQQTLASGYVDFRLRRDTSALTFYRYSSGLAPSHSVTLTASVAVPASTTPTLDFTIASNSPTAISASADSSFYNLSIVVI